MWTCVSRYHNVSILDFVGAKDDGGGGDNWSYEGMHSSGLSLPRENQHPAFLYGPDAFSGAQPTVQRTEGESITSADFSS